MLRLFSFMVLVLIGGADAALAQNLPAPSKWVNQRGSILTIDQVDANGKFKGHFVNNAAGFDCKGISFDVTGEASVGKIAFSVTWANGTKDCHSIALWTGSVSSSTIETTWILAYINPSWDLVDLAGSDKFDLKP